MHELLDSVRWELTRPVGRLRDHLVEGGPLDVLLADLYASIGEGWAVGAPEPPDPRVRGCEHPPPTDGRPSAYESLVANDRARQLAHDLAGVQASSRAVQATLSIGLFPEFRALVGGLADLTSGCATAFGTATRFVNEWDDDAAA